MAALVRPPLHFKSPNETFFGPCRRRRILGICRSIIRTNRRDRVGASRAHAQRHDRRLLAANDRGIADAQRRRGHYGRFAGPLTTVGYYTFGSHYTVTDMQEIKSMVARSRSKAVGAQGGLHGVIGGAVDLVSNFGFGTTRDDHSAQFTRPIQTVLPYYRQMLTSYQILP